MWSSDLDRRGFLASLLILSGCGFRPALQGPQASALAGHVAYRPARNGNEFALLRAVQDRLGLADAPQWQLDYDLSLSRQGFSSGGTGRNLLTGRVSYRLTPVQGAGRPALRGSLTETVAFTEAPTSASRTDLVLSNRAAEEQARARLMHLLGTRLVDDLIARIGADRA